MLETASKREFVQMDWVDVVFTSTRNPSFSKVVPCLEQPHTRRLEVITPNSKGSRKEWKSFEHYKCVHSDPPTFLLPSKLDFSPWEQGVGLGYIPAGTYTCTGWDAYGDPGIPIAGLPALYQERPDGGFVPPPSNLDVLVASSLKTMMPIIKSEMSLVNSAIELKDFKSLPSTLNSLRQVAVRGYRSLRNLLRAGSNVYLQQQFNILPLLSDIAGIHRALSNYERRLNYLISQAGRTQVKHFNFTWNENKDDYSEKTDQQWCPADYAVYPYVTYFHQCRNVRNSPTIFHAEIAYNYVYEQYQLEHARVLGLLDALGVQVNPSIIWNAIPWSFVVDWVFGVSRWLDQYKQANMEPRINILRYLWSVKRSRLITTGRFTPAGGGQDFRGPTVSFPTLHETAYRRHVEMPGTASFITSGLNPKEFSLGAALVFARGRHRRNK